MPTTTKFQDAVCLLDIWFLRQPRCKSPFACKYASSAIEKHCACNALPWKPRGLVPYPEKAGPSHHKACILMRDCAWPIRPVCSRTRIICAVTMQACILMRDCARPARPSFENLPYRDSKTKTIVVGLCTWHTVDAFTIKLCCPLSVSMVSSFLANDYMPSFASALRLSLPGSHWWACQGCQAASRR